MKLKNVTPMLEATNLRQTVEFYSELLGFEIIGSFPDAENPGWVCMKKDDVVLMFTARNAHSKVETTTMTGSLYFYPTNVDEVWEQLKDKATVVYPIENFDYEMREFAIRDCNGYLLQFGQEI